MRRFWIITLFFMTLATGFCFEAGADDKPSADRIRTIEARLDSLKSEKTVALGRADDLQKRIDLLREREPLSRREHRELEKLMQNSQRIETAVGEIDEQISGLSTDYETTLQSIVADLSSKIAETLRAIEASDRENTDLAVRLQTLIAEKETVEARLRSRPTGGAVYHVDAKPWDTPNRLRFKGDLLLDQEESVREEIARVDKRIAALIDEENVRRKVGELVSEMDVFDEHEELFGREVAVIEGVGAAETFFEESRDAPGIQSLSAESIGAPAESFHHEMTAPAPRSADRIREWVSRLQDYRSGLNARADSLSTRARWFHDQADTNRD